MSLEITNPYGAASEDEVAQAEQSLGVTFPPAYRRFLLDTGGAKVAGSTVPGTDGGYLQKLYDIKDLLKWHVDYGRDYGFLANIPHNYIMIGGGSGGAPCVRVKDGDEGSVWWADFEKAGEFEEEEPREEIMIRLADDFDAFLELFD